MQSKACTKCGEVKDLSAFYRKSTMKDGRQSHCKVCQNQRTKAWHNANPDSKKNTDLQRFYGISLTDYNRMFEEQGGRCKICDQEQPGKRLAVDHCHRTGKVRSLLCDPCNKAIGLFQDDPSRIESALNYVRIHEDQKP